MCIGAPKIKPPPPPAQFQQMQVPKDLTGTKKTSLRRRGMWASIFTGPQGIVAAPNVTGGQSGYTGA
jgi:hypothetical protein